MAHIGGGPCAAVDRQRQAGDDDNRKTLHKGDPESAAAVSSKRVARPTVFLLIRARILLGHIANRQPRERIALHFPRDLLAECNQFHASKPRLIAC